MNGIGRIGQGGASFDKDAFRREASSILFEGTREMLFAIKDKTRLVAAYDSMDCQLGELVGRWSPPEELVRELHSKLEDRLNFIGRKMKDSNIDPQSYWEADGKRAAVAVLRALGYSSAQMRIDRLVEEAVEVMSQSTNLTKQGAEKLLREFAAAECRSLTDIMANVRDSPNHREFMALIASQGTPKAKAMAKKVMDRMLPDERKQLAVVIEFPKQPLRQPMMRHQ